ncbi:hypothetical protein BT96DRAFT_949895 [Gymnopus androsaceus JB14]|uniref:Uncharacterized protein n=1 Tax=Gymnopus androsaceus JB14 TaxID=1447944 RepID=A0A6A4GIQ4_9AGAR|nr:hypothetical protein BT96DRAFT_949895 [Gymnopus androsaceus JB14]
MWLLPEMVHRFRPPYHRLYYVPSSRTTPHIQWRSPDALDTKRADKLAKEAGELWAPRLHTYTHARRASKGRALAKWQESQLEEDLPPQTAWHQDGKPGTTSATPIKDGLFNVGGATRR